MATIKSIEEKAKAYDEVREKIAIRFGSNVADEIFSQFEMSEDDRIRKRIIALVNAHGQGMYKDEMLAYLEKQVEQKPAWSEDDENRINRLIAYFEDKESFTAEDDIVYANWLKSLKDRVQPKQEWSEEDEKMLNQIIKDYERGNESWLKGQGSLPFGNRITWLKSLRPQNRWKPSDEQMEALKSSTYCQNKQMSKILFELYLDLKELREE